mgnify:CR=1 FL=1
MSRIDGDRKNICGENIKRYREKKGLSLEQCCVELEQEGLLLSAKELEPDNNNSTKRKEK